MRSMNSRGVLPRADHLVAGDVVGPGRVAEQRRQLVARFEHPLQHRHVLRVAALPVQLPDAARAVALFA